MSASLLEHKTRRQTLASLLPEGALAFIPAALFVLRNGDVTHSFRQHSDFLYLTGSNEPEALLLVASTGASTLFVRPRNPAEEQWTGKRLGADGALDLGVETAYSLDELERRLPEILAAHTAIYYAIGQHPGLETQIMTAWGNIKKQSRRGLKTPGCFADLAPILGELRLFKSPQEVLWMSEAARISMEGHRHAMRASRVETYEYQVEAAFLSVLQQAGFRQTAYESIVASGANACVLHYTDNNQALQKGSLVLMDAGAEYLGYASDITRVVPVDGRFSTEQRLIYEAVLEAQKLAIAQIRPGVRWDLIQQTVVLSLTTSLVALGLLVGDVQELIAEEAYKLFYMHQAGHWLGLDVHDVGAYKINQEWRFLEPGMVLTVEPGLYITPGLKNVHPRWWGIGVRIEDDVLVTAEGALNLTEDLIKEVDAIEDFLRG